jgi:Flp pilus assembly protein TadB
VGAVTIEVKAVVYIYAAATMITTATIKSSAQIIALTPFIIFYLLYFLLAPLRRKRG